MGEMTARNLLAGLKGERMPHYLNPEARVGGPGSFGGLRVVSSGASPHLPPALASSERGYPAIILYAPARFVGKQREFHPKSPGPVPA